MTAIYIRSDLEYSIFNPTFLGTVENNADPQPLEGFYYTGATVKFKNQMICNVLSVYYPKGPKQENTDWIKNFEFKNRNCLIMGDFNAHSTFWEPSCTRSTCNRFVDNILNSKFVLLDTGEIIGVPYVAQHRPSAIDLSLATSSLSKDCIWEPLDDTLGSDHRPIYLLITSNYTYNSVEEDDIEDLIPKFNYRFANWDKFSSILTGIDKSDIENEDLEIFYNNLITKIIEAADQSIPRCRRKTPRVYFRARSSVNDLLTH